ncbi:MULTISPECIES: nuclear transport factor 2 family protein [unclassified Streptomyces]|uniref:nuclear transport factor 2 family protein n=1 Tax=unclassified Streptomyces TaxID=2593676 RepID=UPI001BE63A5A|nr:MULTISPECIES: nuclear transport factor 2 family protein [unclassified Streptomyces]MBT2408854.1 nuclear transport factor 2 family protein [Streptomyces sp. ISL-21]MBT2459462.1 nuclear transport factor 2 family protein [Streptomyces sp. ISL-86]MBT2611663.1 nuclear transport factor 2 family protein [Streptomyces sp. ISL-87]
MSTSAPHRPLTTAEVIDRFNQVFQQHDPSGLAALVADDCVMEGVSPAPDGSRVEGAEDCVRFWAELATDAANTFEIEDVLVAGELSVIRWRFVFGSGDKDYVRCVNVMRVENGLITEACGYAKTA